MKIHKIILYDEPTVPEIQLKRLQKFLINTFPVKIEIRENIFQFSKKDVAKEISQCRISDLKKPFEKYTPTDEEMLIEKENIDTTDSKEMILYDGFEFQKIISKLIPDEEDLMEILHIIFTNKLTCTFDQSDFRYHARAVVGSNPAIISTTGMIEAPAKPKQYYLDLMPDFSEEKLEKIKKKYKGEFLEYHDSRLSDIAEGYLLQAIIYYETGEAFCDQKDCRLFNAHWQKDLFFSQLKNKKFCDKHQKILNKLSRVE